MSSSSSHPTSFRDFGIEPLLAEIVGFPTIKQADEIASSLRSAFKPGDGYDVLTFAAGMYYVVLVDTAPL